MNKRRSGISRGGPVLAELLESRMLLSASPLVVGYLPDYEFSHLSEIDLNALTNINYFSIVASSTGSLASSSSSGYSLSQLQTVVTDAHAASPRVSVSITIDPSTPFLTIAESSTATTNFINNILAFCSKYDLDGIDLDYEPGTLTTAQMDTWGDFLATLHAQTSTHDLLLSEAVQVSQMIIPQSDLSDIDLYNVMDYDLDYNSSAPYSASIAYLQDWANYGVPTSKLVMGVPFYGRSGTSWSNSITETYAQILAAYAAANGGAYPSPSADSVTINGVTWGYNGVDTVEEKTQYVLQNGYGGMMIWELGQDYFTTGGTYGSLSLLPAIESVNGAAYETWVGRVSDAWNTAENWNFEAVPVSTTNVIINGGNPTVSSAFTVESLTLNGGTLTLAAGGASFVTASLAISPGATLDMQNNALFIDYGSNASPISTIEGYLSSGYNGGAWNGTGIISSTAAANPQYGLGYADGADGVVSGLASGQIEIVYTLYGDTNLDGAVNGVDFGNLAANFGKSGPNIGWAQGAFTYNNTVNGVDFGLLAGNFGDSTSLPAVVAWPSDNESVNLAAAATPTGSTTSAAPLSPAGAVAVTPQNDPQPQPLPTKRQPRNNPLLR